MSSEKDIQGCCPMFEDDIVIEKFLSEEEDRVIFGNCLIAENAFVDCRNLIIHGNSDEHPRSRPRTAPPAVRAGRPVRTADPRA